MEGASIEVGRIGGRRRQALHAVHARYAIGSAICVVCVRYLRIVEQCRSCLQIVLCVGEMICGKGIEREGVGMEAAIQLRLVWYGSRHLVDVGRRNQIPVEVFNGALCLGMRRERRGFGEEGILREEVEKRLVFILAEQRRAAVGEGCRLTAAAAAKEVSFECVCSRSAKGTSKQVEGQKARTPKRRRVLRVHGLQP